MDDLSVIDHFLDVFSRYIDSGFGLLGGEVAFLTSTLIVIDMSLAGLFWAMGGNEDVIARLIKKTLYVGTFAFIIGRFNELAGIVFRSFAGLGLVASGAAMSSADLLHPGRLAATGVSAARPLLEQIGGLVGFPEIFHNIVIVLVLFLAWLVLIVSFFVLAVQLFVTLIEFKLTTLAGFVLLPFALWNKTAFVAERVLGNVMASGVKILVLAVIVGIGTRLFGEFQSPMNTEPSIDQALTLILASLALLSLGIFGTGIATGLVSGAPQLGAGAAAGAVIGAGGLLAATATGVVAGVGVTSGAVRAAGALTFSAKSAYRFGAKTSGSEGLGAAVAGVGNVMRGGVAAFRASAAERAAGNSHGAPQWAQRLRRSQQIKSGVSTAAHIVRSGDRGGNGVNPTLRDPST